MKRPAEDEFRRWLTMARDEFGDADHLRRRGRFYIALFHFQQAAEKALKAFLYLKAGSAEVFYTHSIEELLEMAVELDPAFRRVAGAKRLDRYYIPTRYPNGLPGGIPSRHFDDPAEAEDAMRLARAVIELVRKKAPRRGRRLRSSG
ncbi:MAG: HEPN domain-containing protein [Thermoplasmata archaeon]